MNLGESKSRSSVGHEDFLYGFAIGRSSQIQSQIVFLGRPHDLLQKQHHVRHSVVFQ